MIDIYLDFSQSNFQNPIYGTLASLGRFPIKIRTDMSQRKNTVSHTKFFGYAYKMEGIYTRGRKSNHPISKVLQ